MPTAKAKKKGSCVVFVHPGSLHGSFTAPPVKKPVSMKPEIAYSIGTSIGKRILRKQHLTSRFFEVVGVIFPEGEKITPEGLESGFDGRLFLDEREGWEPATIECAMACFRHHSKFGYDDNPVIVAGESFYHKPIEEEVFLSVFRGEVSLCKGDARLDSDQAPVYLFQRPQKPAA